MRFLECKKYKFKRDRESHQSITTNQVMKKHFCIIIVLSFSLNLYSNENSVQLTIPDPVNIVALSAYQLPILKNDTRNVYISFKKKFLEKLDLVQGAAEFRALGGGWVPSKEDKSTSSNLSAPFTHKFSIIIGNHGKLFIEGQHNLAWRLYRYGEYYVTDMSLPDTVYPILLINFTGDRCYFYTLEGSQWILIPFHKNGDICFIRQTQF